MDANQTENTTAQTASPLVSFRGRPKTEITVKVPERRTAKDRALFGEFDGQEKLDAAAAEIAVAVAAKINKQGERLSGITSYSREYLTARVTHLLSVAVA